MKILFKNLRLYIKNRRLKKLADFTLDRAFCIEKGMNAKAELLQKKIDRIVDKITKDLK